MNYRNQHITYAGYDKYPLARFTSGNSAPKPHPQGNRAHRRMLRKAHQNSAPVAEPSVTDPLFEARAAGYTESATVTLPKQKKPRKAKVA